jgi:opacity protein-like surface antigen
MDASVNLKSKLGLGLVSDFSGFYKTYPNVGFPNDQSKTYLYLFGPQYSFRLHRFTPFAHVLFGVGHIKYISGGVADTVFDKQPTFAYGFGGGVDYDLAWHMALRVQADYLHPGFVTFDNQLQERVPRSNSRISTGIVFRF